MTPDQQGGTSGPAPADLDAARDRLKAEIGPLGSTADGHVGSITLAAAGPKLRLRVSVKAADGSSSTQSRTIAKDAALADIEAALKACASTLVGFLE
jgi:hypothetical protein